MKVFYIDDEKKALDKFCSDHTSKGISIEATNKVSEVINILKSKSKEELPEVIVTDLYSTKDTFNSPKAKETNSKVDELVEKIAITRKELQLLVEKSKTPTALDTLKSLKSNHKLRHIPVVINTREGLTLLGDDSFRETIDLGATWMLKGRDPKSQYKILNRAIDEANAKQNRKKERYRFMIYGTILGAILSAFLGLFLQKIFT